MSLARANRSPQCREAGLACAARACQGRAAALTPGVSFGKYASGWIEERPGLRPKTAGLHRYPSRRHLGPAFGAGQVIWLRPSWGGLASGALLAGVYQADAKDGVAG